MVEFISDRMSYITLSSNWCDFIALNAQEATDDKSNATRDSFYE